MIEEDLGTLEKRFQRFRISGSPDVIIEGNIFQGYAVNVPQCPPVGAGTPTPSGACCPENGDCFISTQALCEALGGAYQGDGTDCDPDPCGGVTGACCIDGVCSITTEETCNNAGGTYQGDGTDCDPNPCPQPTTGACCVGTDCSIETEEDCIGMGGTYQGDGSTCDPNPCPEGETGACCVDGVCSEVTAEACAEAGGTYLGNGSECGPITCACPCGFNAFDESGGVFLRYQRSITGSFTIHETACPGGTDMDVSADTSATFEQHYESDGEGGCNLITDLDISSSSRTGPGLGETCSLPSCECFCNVVIPAHNQCTTFFNYCQCGENPVTPTVEEDATTRVTTYDLSGRSCTRPCDPEGESPCDWSGSYVVTEILSEPCIPV